MFFPFFQALISYFSLLLATVGRGVTTPADTSSPLVAACSLGHNVTARLSVGNRIGLVDVWS